MTPYLSKKIKIISFSSMLLVVFLHGQLISMSTGMVLWIQLLITQEITRVAVPLFFLISGYLFFHNYKEPTYSFFTEKIKNRFYTVFIPYVLWSTLGLLFLYVAQIILPASSIEKMVVRYGLRDILYAIFVSPVGTYQLWFLRDLYILVMLIPIIYWGIKYLKVYFVVCLMLFWINGVQCFIQIDAIFFFVAGAYWAFSSQKRIERIHNSHIANMILFFVWVSYCCLIVDAKMGHILHCIGILLGIVCIWHCYDSVYLFLSKNVLNANIYSYSFFIYLTHEPLLTIVKKTSLMLVDNDSMVAIFIIYILSPILVIRICISIGQIMKSKIPSIYSFITGRR